MSSIFDDYHEKINELRENKCSLNDNADEKIEEDIQIDQNSKKKAKRVDSVKDFLKLLYKTTKKYKNDYTLEAGDLEFVKNYKSSKSLFLSGFTVEKDGIFKESVKKISFPMSKNCSEKTCCSNNNNNELLLKESNNNNCCICLEKLNGNKKETCFIQKCKHSFHKDCLLEWLKYNKICPVDKEQI